MLYKLALWVYVKPKPDFNKSIRARDHTIMAVDLEYIKKVFYIRYELSTIIMIRPKDNNKA